MLRQCQPLSIEGSPTKGNLPLTELEALKDKVKWKPYWCTVGCPLTAMSWSKKTFLWLPGQQGVCFPIYKEDQAWKENKPVWAGEQETLKLFTVLDHSEKLCLSLKMDCHFKKWAHPFYLSDDSLDNDSLHNNESTISKISMISAWTIGYIWRLTYIGMAKYTIYRNLR